MKHLIRLSLTLATVFVLSLSFSQISSAQCNVTGTTPGGGEVVVCTGIDSNGLDTTDQPDEITVEESAEISRAATDVINTLGGDDKVYINGGSITGTDNSSLTCVNFGGGNNELHMRSGSLTCDEGIFCGNADSCKITIEDGFIRATTGLAEVIQGSSFPDEIYISGGTFIANNAVIQAGGGGDMVIITGGSFTQTDDSDEAVDTGSDNDLISVSHAFIDGSLADSRHAIAGGSSDDTVKLGTAAKILGLSTGDDGFDTLVFEMEVADKFIDSICANILSQNPAEGQITINGLFYEWENFEVLQCDLRPFESRPIPTLSQWGLIAMAGLVGMAALLAIRKRRVAA